MGPRTFAKVWDLLWYYCSPVFQLYTWTVWHFYLNMIAPLQYSCLENPHGQRCLAGYSPWDYKESDMTEWLSTHTHTPLLLSPCGFSFVLECGISFLFFSDVFKHPPVNDCSAARCDFGVLTEDEHTSFYSTILILSITIPLSIWKPWNFDSTTFKTLPKSFHSIQL